MLAWLSANLINIALIAAIVLVAALVLWGMLRSRKAGKSACGCDCASCGGSCAACRSRHTVRTSSANGEASGNTPQCDELSGRVRCGRSGAPRT